MVVKIYLRLNSKFVENRNMYNQIGPRLHRTWIRELVHNLKEKKSKTKEPIIIHTFHFGCAVHTPIAWYILEKVSAWDFLVCSYVDVVFFEIFVENDEKKERTTRTIMSYNEKQCHVDTINAINKHMHRILLSVSQCVFFPSL